MRIVKLVFFKSFFTGIYLASYTGNGVALESANVENIAIFMCSGQSAVFRKILSSAKNKATKGGLRFKSEKDGASTSDAAAAAQNEEIERKRQEWQEELEEMSEFLYIKSASEQKEEGIETPVDTATIEDKDGMPFLKAVFDVHLFRKDDIKLNVEGDQLVLTATGTEERDERIYTRTIVRKLDLPKHVDPKMMHVDFKNGMLHIEMPFHLPPQKRPQGPNVFPIISDADGRRKLRLMVFIGTDFTTDDVTIETSEKTLSIRAAYDEEIGKYGRQVTQREFKREYVLPSYLNTDHVTHTLAPDGRLYVEIFLKDDKSFHATVETEEVDDVNGES